MFRAMLKHNRPSLKIIPLVTLGLLAGLVANITTESDMETAQEVDPEARSVSARQHDLVRVLEGLQTAVLTLSKDVRCMNVTLVQYEHLARDASRLEKAADLIDQRILVVKNDKDLQGYRTRLEDLKKLEDVREDVRKQIAVRNDAIQKLVVKVESLMTSEPPAPSQPDAAATGQPLDVGGVPPSAPPEERSR